LKIDSVVTIKSYLLIVKTLKTELKKLKQELHHKLMERHPELVTKVSSVKGWDFQLADVTMSSPTLAIPPQA